LGQGYQPPQGQSYVQGMGTVPVNYQSYPQPGYGSLYPQPVMGQYPGVNIVWNPSPAQQVLQPSVQMSSQIGQPGVSGSTQQPVQSNIQTSVTSVVTQSPIAPSTPSQATAATTATSVPSTTLTTGVSTAPVSTVSATTPQTSLPSSGSTIQTTVQMPVRQPGLSTVVTTQPQFIYQPYQGQYQTGQAIQQPVYQYQPYPGYTYQQPQQPQYGPVNPGFPGGYNIPNVIPVPSYPGYPPPGTGLVTQSFRDPNRQLPFIATLDLPDLTRLTNDPINYLPFWPPMPSKLPSDIPKFEGKSGEDPSNHVMTYHLWCASNSISDDSIRLRLFQRTLIGLAAKWYIELPRASFYNFSQLATSFLTHFQLPVRYDNGTELLTSLKQSTSTYISDHIHEWRRRRRLVKVFIPDQIVAEWFVKSLLPKITEDVAKAGVVTEEQLIAQAQYLDLVYTQSGTLHEKIPNLPKTNQIATAPSGSHAADGMIGTVNTKCKKKSSKKSSPIITLPDSPTGESSPEISADIHAVESSTAKSKNGGKKKGKKKNKADKAPKEKNEKTDTSDEKRKPRYPCLICEEDHFTRDCPHRAEVAKIVKGATTPAVLKDPFPKQESKMIGSSSSASEEPILMMSHIQVATRSHDYGSKGPVDGKEAESSHSNPSTSAPGSDPLQIEKPNPDLVIKLPAKGILRKSAFNPHARAAQNYNIVEDLAVSPSAMSALEVLQSCPAQRKLLLSAIGAVDTQDPNLIIFDLENSTPRLPHQMAFQIPVIVKNRPIHRTVIDEGASTCIMSIQCWRSLGSPPLNQSPTILKAFDGRGFRPFGILQELPIEVEGKSVSLDVEVVDAPLDYNLLLGRSWSYAMTAVVSSVFRVIKFPLNGKIVTIDQLEYFSSDPASSETIQHVGKTTIPYKDVGVGLVKDAGLLGTFPFPPINADSSFAYIHMITSETMIYDDPWIIPSESEIDSFGDAMPLSPYELAYEALQSFTNPFSTKTDQMNVVREESFFALTSERITFLEVVSSDE